MRTVFLERASQANWSPRLAVLRSQVKHRPIQARCISSCKHLICDSVQLLVVPDVGPLRGDSEVASQQPRHACIHQGMRLAVDEQEYRVCNVLPNRRNVFECVAITRQQAATGNHLLCQSKQWRCASTPQSYGLQRLLKLVQFALGNSFPAWKALQKTGQEGSDSLGSGALQQHFNNQQQVRTRPGLPPRECPAIVLEPREQAAAKGRGASSREISTWSFFHFHVKITRGRAPRRSSSPWII